MNAPRRILRTVSVCALMLWMGLSATALAETLPQRGTADGRIRTATFNPVSYTHLTLPTIYSV